MSDDPKIISRSLAQTRVGRVVLHAAAHATAHAPAHSVAFGGGIFLLRNGPLPSVAVAPRLFASAAACAPKGLRGANPR